MILFFLGKRRVFHQLAIMLLIIEYFSVTVITETLVHECLHHDEEIRVVARKVFVTAVIVAGINIPFIQLE